MSERVIIMIYKEKIKSGVFLSRPNRFIAICSIDGIPVKCHVKNTGRCKELLIPGAKVYLTEHDDPLRKTAYSLISVYKSDMLINMDSLLPNTVAFEYLKSGKLLGFVPDMIRREYTHGDSRLDLYAEHNGIKYLIEVKGVTLESHGHAKFPDAPTLRGLKHIKHLQKALCDGYVSIILFVLQFEGGISFSPNADTDIAFSNALIEAESKGVKIKAVDCFVSRDEVKIKGEVPVCLNI